MGATKLATSSSRRLPSRAHHAGGSGSARRLPVAVAGARRGCGPRRHLLARVCAYHFLPDGSPRYASLTELALKHSRRGRSDRRLRPEVPPSWTTRSLALERDPPPLLERARDGGGDRGGRTRRARRQQRLAMTDTTHEGWTNLGHPALPGQYIAGTPARAHVARRWSSRRTQPARRASRALSIAATAAGVAWRVLACSQPSRRSWWWRSPALLVGRKHVHPWCRDHSSDRPAAQLHLKKNPLAASTDSPPARSSPRVRVAKSAHHPSMTVRLCWVCGASRSIVHRVR